MTSHQEDVEIERLKSELQAAVDGQQNVSDMTRALRAIENLEAAQVSKESLERSRVGSVVNQIRKANQDSHPDFSKRLKNLIKVWQRIANVSSPSGSRSGTNSGVTTPNTPSGQSRTPNVGAHSRSQPVTPRSAMLRIGKQVTTPSPRLPVNNGISPLATHATPSTSTKPLSYTSTTGQSLTGTTFHKSQSQPFLSSSTTTTVDGQPSPSCTLATVHEEKETNGTTSDDQNNAAAAAPIRLKIRVGGKGASSTLIVPATQSPPTITSSSSSTTVSSPPTSQQQPTVVVTQNGLPPIDLIKCESEATGLHHKSNRKRTRHESSPPPMDLGAFENKSRPSKLKTTAELVAAMTASYPDTMQVNLDHHALSASEPSVSQKSSKRNKRSRPPDSDAGSAAESGSDQEPEYYIEKPQPDQDKDFTKQQAKRRKTSDEQKLEANDVELSRLSSPVVRVERVQMSDDDNVPSTSQLTKTAPRRNWYSILPPLVDRKPEEGVDRSSGLAPVHIDADPVQSTSDHRLERMLWRMKLQDRSINRSANTNQSTSSALDPTTTSQSVGRDVIGLPLVDTGKPDFLEYRVTPNRAVFLSAENWKYRWKPPSLEKLKEQLDDRDL